MGIERLTEVFNKFFRLHSDNDVNQAPVADTTYNQVGIFNESLTENNENTLGCTDILSLANNETSVPNHSDPPSLFPENPMSIVNLPRDPLPEPEIPEVEGVATEEIQEEPVEEVVNKDVDIHISKTVNGRPVDFTYNQADLEDYIIYAAKDKYKASINYFRNVPEIRAKVPEERTKEETKKLEEFDSMVKYVIDAGVEYGVEPQFIIAIIQPECRFNGNIVKDAGKGYMQITSVIATGIAGGHRDPEKSKKIDTDDFYDDTSKRTMKKTMIRKYGIEMVELLESRGFDLNRTKVEEKRALAKEIWEYLINNEDKEFNIRVGTLNLRRLLKTYKGSIYAAAKGYNANGNDDINSHIASERTKPVSENYAKHICEFYQAIKSHKHKD